MTDTNAERATDGRTARSWLAPTLRGYDRAWLGRDVLAGISAGAVVIPQAMAYATIANLPVEVGLYTCMTPLLVYALLGGSRAMSVSTTSTIATLTATTLVAADVAANADDAPHALATLTLLVGLVLVVARLLSLGSLVENINRSTMLGVQIGVGATVAVGQLPKLLGIDEDPSGKGFIRSLVAVAEAVPRANAATITLSVVSIAVLLLLRRLVPRVPGPLLVVAGGIVCSAVFDLSAHGVELVPPVPQGLPTPVLPDLTLVPALLPGALGIATMAFLESAAVARGIRKRDEPQIDSDRELLATAAANVVGAFMRTLPAAGGFSQSAVNQGAGARTQLSSVVTAVLAVVVALFLGPVIGALPSATLACLVIVAVIGLIDIRGLVAMARISRRDFWLAVVTAAIGLSAGLLGAVLVGVLGTFFLILRELQRVRLVSSTEDGAVLVGRVDGSVYTANVLGYERAVLNRVEDSTDVRVYVLEVPLMRELSVTVLDGLEDLDRELAGRGVLLVLAAMPERAAETAGRTEWYRGLQQAGRVFPTAADAVHAQQR